MKNIIPEDTKFKIWEYREKKIDSKTPYFARLMRIAFNQQKELIQKKLGKKFAKSDIPQLTKPTEQKRLLGIFLNPEIIVALEHSNKVSALFGLTVDLTEPEIIPFLMKSIKHFSNSTTDVTNKQWSKSFKQGIEDGDTNEELSKRVNGIFKTASRSRATTIARSELTRTTTYANEKTYRKAGVKFKEWFANPGACQFCEPMNGKIIPINGNFFNKGGDAFGNEGGDLSIDYGVVERPPLHPNCRCDLLPVITGFE